MEGIGGICGNRHRNMGDSYYEWGRQRMTAELNLVIQLLLQHGAEDILINDSHDAMLNLHIDDLPSAARLLSGSHKTDSMMEGLAPDFDAALLIGYHAMTGNHKGILSHTYADSIAAVSINGIPAGEAFLNTAFCGAMNVPVLLVSGDDQLAKEVADFGTGTQSAVVKTGISRTAGIMLHPEKIASVYREALACALAAGVKPLKLTAPLRLEVSLRETQMTEIVMRIPGIRRISDQTVGMDFSDYLTCYRTFILIQSIASANYLR